MCIIYIMEVDMFMKGKKSVVGICLGVLLVALAFPVYANVIIKPKQNNAKIIDVKKGYEDLTLNDFLKKYEKDITNYSGYGDIQPDMYTRSLEYSSREFVFDMAGADSYYLAFATGSKNGATLEYDLHWSISDKGSLTVSQRYDVLNSLQNKIESIFQEKNKIELKSKNFTTKLQEEFNTISKQLSNKSIIAEVKIISLQIQ